MKNSTGASSAGNAGDPPSFAMAYPADLQPTFTNLAYANKSNSQVLDLFIPAGDGPFPFGNFMAAPS